MVSKKRRIVVLDGFALNPGDLNWKPLNELGQCIIYDRTSPGELLPRVRDSQIILTNKVPLSGDVIHQLTELEYIGITATGYNIVDLRASQHRGITVTNVPVYGTDSVAQLVFAHILHLAHDIAGHAASVGEGRWSRSIDWCFWNSPLMELHGKNLGILGLGKIGSATAQIGMAFGMNVIAFNKSPKKIKGVELVELDDLFRRSDFLSLHCPLTPETEKIVSQEKLDLMKPSAFLINTSRGPLVDESALAKALNTGKLAGAGLDVLATEPPLDGNPLLTVANCHITPHLAWATYESRSRLIKMSIDNVASFLRGKPTNVVS